MGLILMFSETVYQLKISEICHDFPYFDLFTLKVMIELSQ
jgi:hypothetical protein